LEIPGLRGGILPVPKTLSGSTVFLWGIYEKGACRSRSDPVSLDSMSQEEYIRVP